MASAVQGGSAARPQKQRGVILASSIGTVFEWYDFYLYATLAPFFAALFFPPGNDTAALLSAFATYAAGFLIRPFGAVIFGRIGDLVGRKYTFLVTIFVMGLATFAVGLLPTFGTQTLPVIGEIGGIGWTAPALLVALRLLQGLALGGEYGGAVTYVAEHAQRGERGWATSWIQTTATLGLFLALVVIGGCRFFLFDAETFAQWGWRVPFLVSLVLLILSVYLRVKLTESPIWAKMNEEGKGSKEPLVESFFRRPNNKYVLLALLGATAGQGVVWYTGQFYALFFLTITLKVDLLLAYTMVGLSLLIGAPFFVLFGWLSDRVGRLKIILCGCLIAAIAYIPLFQLLAHSVNPALVAFQEQNKITLTTDTSQCSFHIFVGPWSKFSSCDRAKDFLTKAGLSFETVHRAGANNQLQIGQTAIRGFDAKHWNDVLIAFKFPTKADPANINWPLAMTILSVFLIFVAMVYGPIAAFLVELFPTRIRYTSMSFPYHIGNGWFGGMLPLLATAIVAWTGNIYAGLYYPIAVALVTVVVGYLLLDETNDVDIVESSGTEAQEARRSSSAPVNAPAQWTNSARTRLAKLAGSRALPVVGTHVRAVTQQLAQSWQHERAEAPTPTPPARKGATPYASVCTLIRTNAIVFALAIALAVPTVIGAVWYTKLLQTNETKAQLYANYLEALLASHDQQVGPAALQGIAASATWRRDDATKVRVMKADGDVVHEWGTAVENLSVVAKSPIVVRGEAIGAVETRTGAATLLYTMLILVVLNSIVAVIAYLGVTKTPIQALHEVSIKLTEHEQNLAEKNTQLDAALENMVQGLCLLDAEQKVVVANERYAEIYKLTPEEIRPGTPLLAILQARAERGVDSSGDASEPAELGIARTRKAESVVTRLADGRFISILGRPLPNGGLISTHEDVTDRKEAEARIAHMAMHDALTGLPNRRYFEDELGRAVQQRTAESGFAVLCLDLDQFKPVNDTLGHIMGDKLLRAVAKRLLASVRETDILARLGGDEFAILQMDVKGPEQPAFLGDRLVSFLAEPFEIDGHRIVIGTSVGIAMAPDDGSDSMELLRNADLALYCSKGEGRGRYRFFEPEMHARVQLRHGLERDLRCALSANQFELHYQPLVDLRTGTISVFEALLRWNHPVRGRVPPSDFIPVVEEMGLIEQIGTWVLDQACREAAKWPGDVRVAVNLSSHQFKSGTLALDVTAALASAGLPPERLELEITETALLQNTDQTIEALQQMRALGVHISMDDFGIGYSSLNYLRAFPFDKIKIDKCFVQDLADGSHSALILKAVVGLAESMGMHTTAEGVETAEQLARLRAEGCTEVQGYYFSAPRPAHEVPKMFATTASKLVA